MTLVDGDVKLSHRIAGALIYGRGVNDADYFVKPVINGVREYCPYYKRWSSMFQRCYSENYQKRAYTYKGCEVCKEWWSFMAFRSWMMKQDWRGEKELDKDFIGDGTLYSPNTCVFIDMWLNKAMHERSKVEGQMPMGVVRAGARFRSQFRFEGKWLYKIHNNIQDARAEYLLQKAKYIRSRYAEMCQDVSLACERKLSKLYTDAGLEFSPMKTTGGLDGKK